MRIVSLLLCCCLFVLPACKGSYAEMAMRSPDELQALPKDQLVAVYANERGKWGENKKLRAEVERRQLFTPDQWAKIEKGTFGVGDPEGVVWVAWGKPDQIHTLTSGAGVSRVLVYGDHADNRVYITDGRVTALGQ